MKTLMNMFRRQRTWSVQVNGAVYEVDRRHMPVLKIAELDRYFTGPDTHHINAKWPGGKRTRMDWHTIIDLEDTEIERFETVPLQAQQGIAFNPAIRHWGGA